MDFKRYLQNKNLSKTTAEHYYYHSMDFITFLEQDNTEVEECTPKEIMLYLNHLQKQGINNDTKKVRLYALKHYFEYLLDNKQIRTNPAKRVKLKGKQTQKLYPILSTQELQNLYTYYLIPTTDDVNHRKNWFTSYKLAKERNKIIISLLIHQGITTTEISRILLEDLDLRKGEIHIRGGRMLKDRTLPLKSSQIIDLMEYQYQTRAELVKFHKEETQQLLLSTPSSGKAYATGNGKLQIWKGITKELKAQESKFIKIQQIRNSVITHWLKTYNLRQVQYKAGHKNIYSTEMYQINDIESLQTDYEQYCII